MSKCGNIDDDDNIITKRFPENYKKKPAKMSVSLFVLIGQWFSFGGEDTLESSRTVPYSANLRYVFAAVQLTFACQQDCIE